MHFHCPAVPLLDSVAAARLQKLVPWKQVRTFALPKHADEYYGYFVMSFLTLYENGRTDGVAVTVKKLDAYLLAYAARS